MTCGFSLAEMHANTELRPSFFVGMLYLHAPWLPEGDRIHATRLIADGHTVDAVIAELRKRCDQHSPATACRFEQLLSEYGF